MQSPVPLSEDLRRVHLEALHVTAGKIANAIEDRNDAIIRATIDGLSAAEIAAEVDLSRQRVWQIAND